MCHSRDEGKTLAVSACVRRFCMDCQGLERTAHGAYDCESQICPLYACSPFRRSKRVRASKAHVRRQCEQCQPGDRTDCGATDCGLFPWRPWQPGGQPKTRRASNSLKRHLRRVGAASQFGDARR